MKKRLLTIALSVLLLIGVIPQNVYADTEITAIDEIDISSILNSGTKTSDLSSINVGDVLTNVLSGSTTFFKGHDYNVEGTILDHYRSITVYEKNDLSSPIGNIWDEDTQACDDDYSYAIDIVFKAKEGYKFASTESNGVKSFDLTKIVKSVESNKSPVNINNLVATVHSDCTIIPGVKYGENWGYPTCPNGGNQDNFLWIRLPIFYDGEEMSGSQNEPADPVISSLDLSSYIPSDFSTLLEVSNSSVSQFLNTINSIDETSFAVIDNASTLKNMTNFPQQVTSVTSGNFETGNIYLLEVYLRPKEGYNFAYNQQNNYYSGTVIPALPSGDTPTLGNYHSEDGSFRVSTPSENKDLKISYTIDLSSGNKQEETDNTEVVPILGYKYNHISFVDLKNSVPTYFNVSEFIGKTISQSPLKMLMTDNKADGIDNIFINVNGNNYSSEESFVMGVNDTFEYGNSYNFDIMLVCDESTYYFNSYAFDEYNYREFVTPQPNDAYIYNHCEIAEDGSFNNSRYDDGSVNKYLYVNYSLDLINEQSVNSIIKEIDLSSYINTDLQDLVDDNITFDSYLNSLNNIQIPHVNLTAANFETHDFYGTESIDGDDLTNTFDISKQYYLNLYFETESNSDYRFYTKYNSSEGFITNGNNLVFNGSILPKAISTQCGYLVDNGDNEYFVEYSEWPTALFIKIDLKNNWKKLYNALSPLDGNLGGVTSEAGVFDVTYNGNVKTVKLLTDIEATTDDYDLSIPNYEDNQYDTVLDLNGHIINRNLISPDGTPAERDLTHGQCEGSVIRVTGGNLTVKDSNPNVKHDGYIDSNNIWHLQAQGHPTSNETPKAIYGGVITGGIGFIENSYGDPPQSFGGGVYIESVDSNVILESGNICGNMSSYGGGGGIAIFTSGDYMDSKAIFTMNGGSICYNYAPSIGGAGIYIAYADVNINGGNIENNLTNENGGGIFGGGYSNINITNGSICNNIAKTTGAICCFDSDTCLKLCAANGKEILITGNSSEEFGNIFSYETHVSGKVIVKDNYCNPYVVDENGLEPAGHDEDGNLINSEGNIIKPHYAKANDYVVYYGSYMQPLIIDGPLTGSDINVSIMYFYYEIHHEQAKITNGYLNKNPGSKANDFIHYGGSEIYYLELDEDGELCVTDSKIDPVASDEGFENALQEAQNRFEKNPEANAIIELSGNIGEEEPLEELEIAPNTTIDLNGNNLHVDGDITIFGGIEDSGDGEKGRIYVEDPENLHMPTSKESEVDREKTPMPTWWVDEEGEGYYCLYELGAYTKWGEVNGQKWQTEGDNVAKFKVQPIIKEESSLKEVYVPGTKLKVGVRITLTDKNGNKKAPINFTFDNDLLTEWSDYEDPTTKCMYIQITGLSNYKGIGAQAALYSKPSETSTFKNSEFHSLYMNAANQ